MAKRRTWYLVVDGVLDRRVGFLGVDEDEALAAGRSSGEARLGVRAVPKDGRFSLVSAKTHRATALADRGLPLPEAIARYHQREIERTTLSVAPNVLLGDDRTRAVPVGRTTGVWELTFTPLPTTAPPKAKPRRFAYYLLYQEKPGGLLHERTDLDSEPQAEAAVNAALGSAEVGSYAVVWCAPYQEGSPWPTWAWERVQAHLKTGPRNVTRVAPVTALSAIPRQRYLDRDTGDAAGTTRYLVSTEMDVDPVGDQYRATGMHHGATYEGWGRTGRAAVRALKTTIESADPNVRITRARSRR
jgi:hypothetical protein